MNAPAAPAPGEDWQAGWWSGARAVPSPNFGPRPAGVAIDLVVLHSISLPPGEYGGDGIVRLFTNTLDWSAHSYYEGIRGLLTGLYGKGIGTRLAGVRATLKIARRILTR